MNILVTGAYGQLGSELNILSKSTEDFHFYFTDADTLDITDKNALAGFLSKNKIVYVVNCAAYTAVDKAENETDKARLINSEAVKNIVTEGAKRNIKFIHISTDYVFDGNAFTPYSEEINPNPQSAYGLTKLEGEKVALSYENSIILRTSWLYSSFGNNFVKTMLRLGKERSEVKVVFDQIGTPTYAGDLAEAILKIINFTENKAFLPGIYHFSNEGVCSWYDLAWEIMNYSNLNCKVIPILSSEYPTLTKRPYFSVLNKNKLKACFNLEIPYWKTSLYKCLSILNN